MRFQQKLVAAVALGAGTERAFGCSCFFGASVCDKFGDPAIVLRAEVLSR